MQARLRKMTKDFDEKIRENKHKQEEMIKIIEKKNYESHYMVPEAVRKHRMMNPKSFDIQGKAYSRISLEIGRKLSDCKFQFGNIPKWSKNYAYVTKVIVS